LARKKTHERALDGRGRLLIERRNLPPGAASSLLNDAYHFLLTASWTRITVLFAATYLVVNVLFAAVLWVGHANVTNVHGFIDYFWFSVQTLATIGYGVLAPNDTLSNVVVTIESFLGFGLTAVVTGVFFARVSTPTPRLIFSSVAIITEHDGQRVLTFRLANARQTAIVEASVRVYMTRNEQLASGERLRRIYDLELRRSTSPVFNLSWTVYHVIDERSPFHGVTAETLADRSPTVIVTFQGIDDRMATVVHTRFAYNPEEIVFDRRFADIIKTDVETGERYLDFAPFHTTEPLGPFTSGG
jgi:inward rectifier potassium channel